MAVLNTISTIARGRLITMEGIDGSGKTTNLSLIQTLLEQAGIAVLVTREPGGTQFGEELRQVLLRQRTAQMESLSELLLLAAARAEHIAKCIIPALIRGEWVLCDRFSDASRAYQGGGRKMDFAIINALERIVLGDVRPDLTLLFDLPVELGLARAKRRAVFDRFDNETTEFFQRVRHAYLDIAAVESQRIKVIDAACPLPKVQDAITKIIEKFLQ